ncbi:MAG: M28 family peptidase [Chloroflexi bacterium]|nr:M28 family peptidase [Chloroflexota bacterium]
MTIEDDVAILATSLGREVGTPGHESARIHIIDRLTELGLQPYIGRSFEANYAHDEQNFCNLLAIAPGNDRDLNPVLIGAHYDTCGDIPGADDNAAAVAALISTAENLIEQDLERSVIFAFFDAEEPPHFLSPSMGSVRFYEDQKTEDIYCAVIMDLVGHDVPVPGLEDVLFIMGMESNQGLEQVIQHVDPGPNLRILPTLNRYVGDMSDHHIFRTNQVPYLFLSCGRWEHYHQDTDTPEKLNYGKIEAVSDLLTDLTINISRTDMEDEFEGYDSSSTEIRFIQENLMPVISAMGLTFNLETRADIDRLASMMLTYLPI